METDVEILAGDLVIGRSTLRDGDRSQGVAFGMFMPNDAYVPLLHAWNICGIVNDTERRVPLVARDMAGQVVEALGIDLLDFADPRAPDEREVHVIGIPCEIYQHHFGQAEA